MNPGAVILIAAIVLFGAVCIWLDYRDDYTLVIICKIIVLLAAIVIIGTFGIVAFVPEQNTDNVTVESKNTEIYTFSDNAASNSGFIVAADNEYYFYYKTNSGIKQGKIPTNKTTVVFTTEPPTLHTETKTTVTHSHWWWILECENTVEDKSYTLYVPEGAINISIVQPNSD